MGLQRLFKVLFQLHIYYTVIPQVAQISSWFNLDACKFDSWAGRQTISTFLGMQQLISTALVWTPQSVQSTGTVQSAPSVQILDALRVSRATRPSRADQRPESGRLTFMIS